LQGAAKDSTDGYGLSKWVAEELVRRHGPANSEIIRLPFISFARKTGASNPKDWYGKIGFVWFGKAGTLIVVFF
jgi:thioester reductase-like protein